MVALSEGVEPFDSHYTRAVAAGKRNQGGVIASN